MNPTTEQAEGLATVIDRMIDQHGTLRAVSRATGVDVAYLSRLHKGEKDAPSDDTLRKLGVERVVLYRSLATHPNHQSSGVPAAPSRASFQAPSGPSTAPANAEHVVLQWIEMREWCEHYHGIKETDESVQCSHPEQRDLSNWCSLTGCPLLKSAAIAAGVE